MYVSLDFYPLYERFTLKQTVSSQSIPKLHVQTLDRAANYHCGFALGWLTFTSLRLIDDV